LSAFATLVRRTPLVPAPALGANVWLKLECLQRTGSFKLRGAALRLDALTDEERAAGVVTASAGNHGQGVALAGTRLGIATFVFVPASAPEVKKRAIAAYGATVLEHAGGYDAAEAAARAHAEATGMLFVSAFDDPWVIRGNGSTIADEIREQLPEVAAVVAPVGGGGLMSGLAQVLAPAGVRALGVSPEVNCAMHDSLARGEALTVYEGGPTLAEGCEGAVAENTFALCRRFGVEVKLVSEAAIRRAVAFAYRRLGLIVEATGAVGLAGVLEGVVPASGVLVVVVTGGNVNPELTDEILRGEPG
jgi:threonine dehydratase